jgi:hypothetical protein
MGCMWCNSFALAIREISIAVEKGLNFVILGESSEKGGKVRN